MNRRWVILTLISFFLLFLTTGCWDSEEVEQLAIVTISSFDRITEDGVDKWQVAAKILHPAGKLASGDQSGTAKAAREILLKGTGVTIQDAFTDLVKRLPNKPFYAHRSSIVIGERAAQEGLADILEISIRYQVVRPHMFVLVTKGEAFDVLQTEPEMTTLLADEIKRLTEDVAQSTGRSYGVTVSELANWMLDPDRDAIIPQIKIYFPPKMGNESVSKTPLVEGFGVIRKGKLVGWLTPEESLGYLLIAEKTGSAQIRVPVQFEGKLFTYGISGFKSRITPQVEDGKISYTIKIDIEGAVFDNDGVEVTSETIPSLEEAADKRLQEIAFETIAKAKDYDADFLGLTQQLHRYKLRDWEKIKDNWREDFSDVNVQVEINAKIKDVGRLTKKLEFH